MIFHYFLIRTIYSELDIKDGGRSGFAHSSHDRLENAANAFYRMFILMTTANHPDLLMEMVSRNILTSSVIVSYMCITNIILMNLVLAIVTDCFELEISETSRDKYELREAMLETAFYRLAELDPLTGGSDLISCDTIIKIMDELDNYRDFTFFEFLRALFACGLESKEHQEQRAKTKSLARQRMTEAARLLVNKTLSRFGMKATAEDASIQQLVLMICNFNTSEQRQSQKKDDLMIDVEEFRMLTALYYIPFRIRDWYTVEEQFNAEKLEKLNLRESMTANDSLKMFLKWNTSDENSEAWNWAACYPKIRYFWLEAYIGHKKCNATMLCNVVVICSVLNAFLPEPASTDLWPIYVVWFWVEVVMGMMAGAIKTCWYQYLRESGKWLDFVLAIVATITLFIGNMDGSLAYHLWTIARLLRVVHLMMTIKPITEIFFSVRFALITVYPYLLLFFVTLLAFTLIGVGLFAGTVTKVTSLGGPGHWDTAPWNTTAYGKSNGYYQLNFDSMLSSTFTLFVCAIQNNWHVVVNGFENATGDQFVRLFFMIYNIIMVFVMFNIFAGALISSIQKVAEERRHFRKMGKHHDDEHTFQDLSQGPITVELKVIITEWMANHSTSSGIPYIYMFDLGTWNSSQVSQEEEYIFRQTMELIRPLRHLDANDSDEDESQIDVKESKPGTLVHVPEKIEQHYLELLSLMDDPVYVRRDSGRVVMGNFAFSQLVGRQSVQMLKHCQEKYLFDPIDLVRFENEMNWDKSNKDTQHKYKGEFIWNDAHKGPRESTSGTKWLVKFKRVALHTETGTFISMHKLGPADRP